jgi:hypothetical protein
VRKKWNLKDRLDLGGLSAGLDEKETPIAWKHLRKLPVDNMALK